MASPVSTDALNLSASGTAFAADSTRNAANAAPEMRFSDLLLGRIQRGAGLRAPETSPVMTNPAPTRTRRDATRATDANPASADSARRPTREREPERAAGRDKHAAPMQRAEQKAPESSAPQPQANAETLPSGQNGPAELPDDAAQTAEAVASSDSAATIAALLSGIAAETGKDAVPDESAPESAEQNPLAGRARHSATVPQEAMKRDTEAENDATAEDGGTPAHKAFIQEQDSGRARQPVVLDRAGPVTQGTIAAAINAAAVQSLRADGNGRSAPAGAPAQNAIPFMPDAPRTAAASQAGALQFTVPPGAGQRAWAEEIGNRVMWMMGRAESRAELILTPPHLGKVEVSIQLNGDQSTAQFLASTQAAREALEQAMPRLRELLAQAGISLGEASVNTSAEDRANGEESAHRSGQHTPGGNDDTGNHDDAAFIPSANRALMNDGLVDTFA